MIDSKRTPHQQNHEDHGELERKEHRGLVLVGRVEIGSLVPAVALGHLKARHRGVDGFEDRARVGAGRAGRDTQDRLAALPLDLAERLGDVDPGDRFKGDFGAAIGAEGHAADVVQAGAIHVAELGEHPHLPAVGGVEAADLGAAHRVADVALDGLRIDAQPARHVAIDLDLQFLSAAFEVRVD